MEVFEEIIDEGATLTPKFARTNVNFGDGYAQSIAYGINNVQQQWTISVTDRLSKIMEIVRFFNSKRKVEPFIWINPFGEELIVKVDNVKLTGPDEGGIYVVSATFTEEI